MSARFEVEPSSSALERRATISSVIPPGRTGNEFAVEPGKPGHVLIITGGNEMRPYRGIGAAVGIEAASRGMDHIVITSTTKPESEAQAHEAAQAMADQGAHVLWLGVDHTQREDNIAVVETTFDRFGRVNYLFGNAGGMQLRPTMRTKYEDAERGIALMLTANYQLCKAIYDQARKTETLSEFKAVVFSGSVVGRMSSGWQAWYAMAKMGLIGLVIDLGAEFGPDTRVNVAELGYFRTRMTKAQHTDEKSVEFENRRIALKRIGEPEEAAKAVVFLLGPDASYITRSVLTVDGGILPLAR